MTGTCSLLLVGAVLLDEPGTVPLWTTQVKRIWNEVVWHLEKFMVMVCLGFYWAKMQLCPMGDNLSVIRDYWELNYRVELRQSLVNELDDLLLTAMVHFASDKGRSFYVIKLIFHIEELIQLGFLNFLLVIFRTPTKTCWELIEVAAIRKLNVKMICEIRSALKRFKQDGVFFIDADHLVINRLTLK